MKLLTKQIETRFKKLGRQDIENPIIVAKFFTPWSNWTWFAISYTPSDKCFFGYVEGMEKELGYFSLEELEGVTGPAGLKIERDLHWKEKKLSEVKS